MRFVTATALRSLARRLDAGADAGSGPAVARLFHALLAAVLLAAWLSLGAQLHALAGSRGLLPAARLVALLREAGEPWYAWPTVFRAGAGDAALSAGVAAGALLALCALAGARPRACFAASAALYLSYATACGPFLAFQWDSLLIECCVLAALLPRERRARWAHFLFRALLFKLYWESGLAKWQSVLHDWHDGSAMRSYYETAPLPTPLAWYAHHLPAGWHAFESRAVLALELVVPFMAFGPRRARLAAAVSLTAFQVANVATGNYAFFCWLALALHAFLLDDADVARARAWLCARLPARARRAAREEPAAAPADPEAADDWASIAPPGALAVWWPRARAAAFTAFAVAYLALSVADGVSVFGPRRREEGGALEALGRYYRGWRVANSYHLFAQITRERVEPEFQTLEGDRWTPRWLRHKPGETSRAPGFVAPHQPRLDFQLWFYGLSFRRGAPSYVARLAERACDDPGAVRDFFRDPLPARPRAVRVAFWRYRYTTPAERRATGAWWRREYLGATDPLACRGGEGSSP